MKEILTNLFSRKFLALVLGTYMLYLKDIDQYVWLAIVAAYLGSNIADKYLANKGGTQ